MEPVYFDDVAEFINLGPITKMRATRLACGTTSKKQKAQISGNVIGVTITPITTPRGSRDSREWRQSDRSSVPGDPGGEWRSDRGREHHDPDALVSVRVVV